MKTIAVVLSGCGVFEGSEIYETVCTLLAIEKNHARYQCMLGKSISEISVGIEKLV